MGLLDELRNETADKKAKEQREKDEKAKREAFYQDTLKPRLENIYAYLYEFVEQLNYLRPDVPVAYRITGEIAMRDLLQGEYSLKVDSRDNMTEIILRLYCKAEGEIHFEVDNKAEFENLIDLFQENRLRYQRRTLKDAKQTVIGGDFTIEKQVPIYFKFEADIENGCIFLWIRNFEKFGLRKIILLPHQVNDDFLDDIGKYILRKTDSFMQLSIEEDKLNRIRDKIEQDRQDKELQMRRAEEHRMHEEQAEREKKLHFRIKNQIKGIYDKVKKKP